MICGGITSYGTSDYVNVINGGGSASIIDHPLSKFELFLLIAALGFGFISMGLGHMVMADMLYASLATYLGYAFGTPMVLALSLLGACLVLGGLFAFAALYKSFFATIINTRRRKLVYVV